MDPIDYYNQNAESYYNNTVELNMDKILEKFCKLLPEDATILDLGCGSGRDSLYFIEEGYDVTALDGSLKLCELAKVHIGQDVLNMLYEDMDFENVFDGVWACASLVHILNEDKFLDIINKIFNSMKKEGILYISLRYGDDIIKDDNRYYKEYSVKEVKNIINNIDYINIEVIDIWKTQDLRKENKEWVNILIRKI